ncbi:MAG: penicillin-binding protein 1C [Tateyamaria sp.]
MIRLRLISFGLAMAVLAGACAYRAWDDWVDRTVLPSTLSHVSVEMQDRDGRLMRAFSVEDGRLRLAVAPDRVDPRLIDMLVGYEDKRFYRHNGVDARAMIRATAQAIWHGRIVSGGSTLTMQTARLLENSGTGTLTGKLRQMRVAWALERRLSKPEILHLYFQNAPYGGRIEGVRSATFTWFGKEPHRLTEAEAALLVALPQAPEARRPDRFPDQARTARDRVLARLGHAPTTTPVPTAARPLPQLAPHHADALRRERPDATRLTTTLSRDVQSRLERLVQMHAAATPPDVSLALMVMDHLTGDVLARIGSPAYSEAGGAPGFVDMTRAKRSPGSTLKPLIYALAFDRGLAHPETVFSDRPVRFGAYAPQNFDGVFRGDVTARQALTQSLNLAPVQLTHALGPERLMAALRALGTHPQLSGGQAGLAVALGGVGLSLEELVTLYAQLAAAGDSANSRTSTLIAPRAAWQVGDILRGIAPPPGAPHGLAYKTGTSYGHRDAWAIGFDGRHVVGVWMGRPDGTPVPGAFGGDHAAPILFEAFGRLKPGLDPAPPPPPDTLLLHTADLPLPLQRFGSGAVPTNQPEMTFPPHGAQLAHAETVLKVAGGRLPFTVLVNGAVVATQVRDRQIDIGTLDAGFSDIAVIDAAGASTRASVRVVP